MLAITFRILLLTTLLLTAACNRNPRVKTTEFYGNAMTIDYHVIIGEPLSPDDQQKVASVTAETFAEVNGLYNKWNDLSELGRINRMSSGEQSELSPQLKQLLILTDKVVTLTQGRFDPTIESLQALWKAKLSEKRVPDDSEIAALLPSIGWDKIHISGDILTKDHSALMIDLGGVAKGYAVDLLVENLAKENFSSIYVEWGGEIRTVGKHPYNRPWRIYISRFEDTNVNNALAIVELEDLALATSGDYLQKWEIEDISYFHVLNPKTGSPYQIRSDSIASASIACKSCALADALATAAMTFENKAKAIEWLETLRQEIPELQYWLFTHNQKLDE